MLKNIFFNIIFSLIFLINLYSVDGKAAVSTSNDFSSIIIVLIIIGGGIYLAVYNITTSFKLTKFKKFFNGEKVYFSLKKQGFWGASDQRLIYADNKLNLLYNYTYKELLDEKEDPNFANKFNLIIKSSSKGNSLFKYVEKMIKCTEFPQFEENILNKTITQNMPSELVNYIFGKPGDIKQQVLKNKTKLQYFYSGYTTNRNTIKYRLRVDLEDNLVVGWKDL